VNKWGQNEYPSYYSTVGHGGDAVTDRRNLSHPVTIAILLSSIEKDIHHILGKHPLRRGNGHLSDVRAIYPVVVGTCDLHLHKLVIDSLGSLVIPLYLSKGDN
jgi:hypothetical protein